MLIIYDKIQNKIVDNFGTNSKYPDGDIPNVYLSENQIKIKINDDSIIAKQIINSNDYDLELNDDYTVKNVIINKTNEQYIMDNPTSNTPIVDTEMSILYEAIAGLYEEIEKLKGGKK